jgi:hypothetical protein
MKTFFLILMYFISGWVYSQDATIRYYATELLLKREPTRVEQLIKFAHTKWGNDKALIDYEVEKQAYSYVMVYAKIGNPATTKEQQLIIRQTILKEVIESESIDLERVDWFNVYRDMNQKLKKTPNR